MEKSAGEIWDATLGGLEVEVTKSNYQTWLKDTVGLSYRDGYFVVGAPNAFAVAWLEKRLYNLIKKTLSGVLGCSVEVKFEVNQAQQGENSVTPEIGGKVTGNQCNFNPKYTFDTFVVGSSNRLAHAAALGVASNPGKMYNPLFLYGGAGLGKTHLLHAIGQACQDNYNQIVYVTTEQFTNEFISSVMKNNTAEFRDKYRSADVLLIDDIQFIANKESTQEGLFHTFNELHSTNRQIVISSDRPPKTLSLLEERLRSRFEWGLIADIQYPDFETRAAILQAKAEELNVTVPLEVFYLISRRVQNNIRELEGALNRVIAYAKLLNSPISTDLVVEALMDISIDETRKSLTYDILLEAVASYFGLTPEALISKKRDKAVAFARQVAMYLMREEMNTPWTEIGRTLGGRDHSTVVYGYSKISAEVEASSALRRDVLEIKERLYS